MKLAFGDAYICHGTIDSCNQKQAICRIVAARMALCC